ncbi:hypothetical protein A6F53_11645 [Levilactobacillus brevis]|uniref:DUF4430 domain-containing protein n=1 Tax=Levilactobacillus brevis TaxID=1580 RepID=UPI0007F93B89|nr:DUF4430 domain-containing protein [Levilactobacillus brevis]ANN49861.1 hypothetical protein A6F53_11645 [Levilactobacillus brevis]
MRKTKGIIAAVIVTILLIGGALAFQQNHANQASENVTATSQSVTSSSQAASATSQSRVNHKHQSSSATKKAHKSATKPKNSTSSTNDRHHSSKTQVKTQSSAATATSTKKRRATKQSAVTASKTARKAKSTKAEKKVYLVVSGYKKTFFKGNVVIHGSATAFSVLQASKLKVVYQNGASVYVSSINGLAQNDVKVGSGWKYKVNNKFIDKAANLKRVSAGDRVHWYFTTAGY